MFGKINDTKKNELRPIPAAKQNGLLAINAIQTVATTAPIIPPTKHAFQIGPAVAPDIEFGLTKMM